MADICCKCRQDSLGCKKFIPLSYVTLGYHPGVSYETLTLQGNQNWQKNIANWVYSFFCFTHMADTVSYNDVVGNQDSLGCNLAPVI